MTIGPPRSLDFRQVPKVAFDPDEAASYLGLPSRSAIHRLVDAGELCPMTYGKQHVYHVEELNRFLADRLAAERHRRGHPQE